ncbi:SLC13 family permease [Microbacterium esteraromaticum]|uniref:SLC13 family permease n=1 Tax=Microbacterium esteraromaticum TaxID=57043 RepID=A0A7D7W6V5_9MICO|nr:SLC13 family permease [Microbacterium esteraromaticum]QMU96135.1 SLC13 family permease [Microbacterium esteraromaticum]
MSVQTTPPAARERVRFATEAPRRHPVPHAAGPESRRVPWRLIGLTAVLTAAAALLIHSAVQPVEGAGGAPTPAVALTIGVFLVAVWAWSATRLDDTLVALFASIALILLGVLPASQFFASLGDETIWLLVGAFVIAAGVSASGLALRGAAMMLQHARGPRSLFHLTTVALTLTAFAIPATSGRAALAVPVFTAVQTALPGRARLLRAYALLVPTVVLLSAVASLLGAGAHVITDQLLRAAGEPGFGFVGWLWLGLPLAVVSSHVACEIILLRFADRAERTVPLRVDAAAFRDTGGRISGPLRPAERRAGLVLISVVLLWSTTSVHQLPPALVALLGAVAVVTPGIGCTTLPAAVKTVPWGLLLFLAATLALASALTGSGAAEWLGGAALAPLSGLGHGGAIGFVLVVIVSSTAAHLLIPSRSARSAALIPVVIAIAPAVGVEPMAAAFASTAAAGFCHTLPSSAKPVAMFADPEVVHGGFTAADLRRLSTVLAPVMVALVALFSFAVWPAMRMPMLR